MSVINWLVVVFLNKLMKIKNYFISRLPTAKLKHKNGKPKQATHIAGSWFKKSITEHNSNEKTKISLC